MSVCVQYNTWSSGPGQAIETSVRQVSLLKLPWLKQRAGNERVRLAIDAYTLCVERPFVYAGQQVDMMGSSKCKHRYWIYGAMTGFQC